LDADTIRLVAFVGAVVLTITGLLGVIVFGTADEPATLNTV
jgi:hypothetical protein